MYLTSSIQLTDHHFLQDGTTLVHGDFYLRMPKAFLKEYWGIDDPTTLASDGLNASVGAGGGTLSVTRRAGEHRRAGGASRVSRSRAASSRSSSVVVTPRAPTHVKAHRTSDTAARVTFHPGEAARPEGAGLLGELRRAPDEGRRAPLSSHHHRPDRGRPLHVQAPGPLPRGLRRPVQDLRHRRLDEYSAARRRMMQTPTI